MLIFYLVAAAIALVWGAFILRRTGLFGGCIAFVLLAACFGYEFYHFSVGPLPLTSDRIVLGLLTVVYLAARRLGWMSAPGTDLVDMLLGSFLLMLAANTMSHHWQVDGAQPLARLLFFYIAPAIAYWLYRQCMLDERYSRWLCGFLALFGLYLAATAVAEVKQFSAVVFPSYILTSSYKEWLGRARGPFLNPVTNGMFLSAGLFAATVFWPRVNRIGKVGLVLGMTFLLLGVYYTLTRSCWMGAVCGLGLIVFASIPSRFRIPLGLTAVVTLGLAFALKGNHLSSFKRDKDVSEFHMAQSAELRPMLAYVAWKIAMDYPLFGCGLGQYKHVDADYLRDPNVNMPLERLKPFVQHNVFLSLLTETGFVGCGMYLLLLGTWALRSWKLWRTTSLPLPARQFGLVFLAFLANWCINGLFHDTSLMVNGNLLLFVLAGATQGLYVRAKSGQRAIARRPIAVPQSRFRFPAAQNT
jgi:hypothetical protein